MPCENWSGVGARSTRIERQRAEAHHSIAGGPAGAAALVDRRRQNIGVKNDLDSIPVVGVQRRSVASATLGAGFGKQVLRSTEPRRGNANHGHRSGLAFRSADLIL